MTLGSTARNSHQLRAQARAALGLPMQPVLVRQTVELDDGLARDWVQPASGVDRHHGYAVQWYAIAAVTAGLWLWLSLRPRRRGASDPGSEPR